MKKCFLCNSYQKFYSSLLSLKEFIDSKDFFVMVSSLDKFFSEYRNITFVLQKSISGLDYDNMYEQLNKKYIINNENKWLKDKRNEVLKEEPFNLQKIIFVNVYLWGKSNNIIKNKYSFENWDDAEELTNQIKKKLKFYNSPEIYLSVQIIFKEKNKEIDIMEYIQLGINNMLSFLEEFELERDANCDNCEKLKSRIFELIGNIKFQNKMFERDYEYIPRTNVLEEKSIMEVMGKIGTSILDLSERRMAVKENFFFKDIDTLDKMFEKFIAMHTLIYAMQKRYIMPAIFVFYNDDTFSVDSFLAESKSTIYRKINNIASKIERDSIIAVFVVWESYFMNVNNINMNDTYENRVKNSETKLCFYYIDKRLNEKSTMIDSKLIQDDDNLHKVVRQAISNISNDMKWYLFSSLRFGFIKSYHKYLNLNNPRNWLN